MTGTVRQRYVVPRRRRRESGFTIVELLIAATVLMLVTGAFLEFIGPALGTFQAQPEVADVQQRLRVSSDVLAKDLMMAGAGMYTGTSSGSLHNYFAPVVPYRVGDRSNDARAGVFFRPDAISVIYVPPTPAQATIRPLDNGQKLARNASELLVTSEPNCPPDRSSARCGFTENMRVLLFTPGGAFDVVTISGVQDAALRLQYAGDLSVEYPTGSPIAEVATHTYYLKSEPASSTFQLMHYDGHLTDLPVVDNVVALLFEYWGTAAPPMLLPNKPLTDTVGPWTTYGPRPPAIGQAAPPATAWPDGENCVFSIVGGLHVPRLPSLGADSSQVQLSTGMLTDGPWCPDALADEPYDADLLRVRRIRVRLRVQVASAALRGPAGALFMRGGTSTSAERYIPDQEIRFDITPRNMNAAR